MTRPDLDAIEARAAAATVEWRKIPGLPPEYEISSVGDMRRLDRRRVVADGRVYHDGPRTLRGFITDKGYRAYKGAGFSHITAHRAVALAFLGPPPDGCEVCHADGDKLNNSVANLRYDTRIGNLLDRRLNGVGATHGEKHAKTNLSDSDVRKIRHLYWVDGQSARQIASRFSIGIVTAWQVASGKTWTHLPMPDAGSDIIRDNAALRLENETLRARLEEAELCLLNERGEGEPPVEGWVWDGSAWVSDALGGYVGRPTSGGPGWEFVAVDDSIDGRDDVIVEAPTARAAMRAASVPA